MLKESSKEISNIYGVPQLYNAVKDITFRGVASLKTDQDVTDPSAQVPSNIDANFDRAVEEFASIVNKLEGELNIYSSASTSQVETTVVDNNFISDRIFGDSMIKYNNVARLYESKNVPQQKKDYLLTRAIPLQSRILAILNDLKILIRQSAFIDIGTNTKVSFLKKVIPIYAFFSLVDRQLRERKLKTIGLNDLMVEEFRIKNDFGSNISNIINKISEAELARDKFFQALVANKQDNLGHTLSQHELSELRREYFLNLIKDKDTRIDMSSIAPSSSASSTMPPLPLQENSSASSNSNSSVPSSSMIPPPLPADRFDPNDSFNPMDRFNPVHPFRRFEDIPRSNRNDVEDAYHRGSGDMFIDSVFGSGSSMSGMGIRTTQMRDFYEKQMGDVKRAKLNANKLAEIRRSQYLHDPMY